MEAVEAAETFEDKIFNHLESFKKSNAVLQYHRSNPEFVPKMPKRCNLRVELKLFLQVHF